MLVARALLQKHLQGRTQGVERLKNKSNIDQALDVSHENCRDMVKLSLQATTSCQS
jgi:hypothetical protein